MPKIKLAWEFRGPAGYETAKHHVIHLNEYLQKHQLTHCTTSSAQINEVLAVAELICNQEDMNQLKTDLKPQKGFVLKDS